MADPGAIVGVVGSLKTASDLVGAFLKLRDSAAMLAKVNELQGIIFTAQSSALAAQADQTALLKRIGELEKQIADDETWQREKARYELREVGPGSFAYVLKPTTERPEPTHMLCPNCYQHGRPSILQQTDDQSRRYWIHLCPECQTKVAGSLRYVPEIQQPNLGAV